MQENIESIHLLGGEPTARKDFVEILKGFERKNIKFGFNTNGLKINDENIVNEIINNDYLRNIVFSLEGPNAEINDMIRGKNVFDITVKNIKNIMHLKEKHKLDKLMITINTVLSKTNMKYIDEMIDFCNDLGVDQFVLLQFIAGGNAKENDYSIDFQDEIEIVELIAKKYDSIKSKISIVPRFTMPLAVDYARKVLSLDFPDVVHGCGAGTNFAYMNNKGEVYPCDRYSDKIRSLHENNDLSLLKNNFFDIWGLEGFGDLYSITEGNDFYKNAKPCDDCEYLQKSCYPCPISINQDSKEFHIDHCSRYKELIESV